ncbi:MAG: hypothetical protein C4319_04785 [Acidimicrobiia bacterium]
MRFVIAFVAASLILLGAVVMLRVLANPPPSDRNRYLEDVSAAELTYACSVCGMEVKVVRKPHGEVKPPRHCGEAMELSSAGL